MGAAASTTVESDGDFDELCQDFRFQAGGDKSYLNEELSDFKVIVKYKSEIWKFPCHRFVLCKHKNALADRCKQQNFVDITITDTAPEIMEMVLRYLYEKEILLDDWKMACEVLDAACKYQIKPLVQECEAFLLKSLTFRNVCVILEKNKTFSLEKLNEQCLDLCKNAAFIVLQTKAFISLPEKLVKDILEIDGLNVRNEYSLFQALWNWSRMQCVRENSPLSGKCIGEKFSNVADFVKFECMTALQKELLPEFIKYRYSKSLHNDSPRDLKDGRCIKFPLSINKDLYYSLEFECKKKLVRKELISGSFVNGIKFCVKLDAYLISFATLCLKHPSCTSYVKELKLSSSAGIILDWKEGSEKYVRKITSEEHIFSIADSTMVKETEFHAVRPLPLHPGIEYCLEITPSHKELEWPQIVPRVGKKKSDLDISLCSELCCGLKKITFVQGK